jgi:hypothetical protein
VEEEELLLLTNLSVISPSSLLKIFEMCLHRVLVRERDAVDALQTVVLSISEEVRGGVLHDLKLLYPSGMRYVRSSAKIDEWSVAIHGRRGAVGDLVLDDVLLIRI